VLTVGTPTGDNADRFIEDTLAVLLPLSLPDASEAVVDPLGEVRRQLPGDIDQVDLVSLFAAAPGGTEAVQEALRELLEAALDIEDTAS
jgi:hypothetical protein